MNWQTGARLHWLEHWGGVKRQTLHVGGRVMVTMESHLAFKWGEEGKHHCRGPASQLLTVLRAQTCVIIFFQQQEQTFLSLNIVDWVSSVVRRPFLSPGLERGETTVGCWRHWHFCWLTLLMKCSHHVCLHTEVKRSAITQTPNTVREKPLWREQNLSGNNDCDDY